MITEFLILIPFTNLIYINKKHKKQNKKNKKLKNTEKEEKQR